LQWHFEWPLGQSRVNELGQLPVAVAVSVADSSQRVLVVAIASRFVGNRRVGQRPLINQAAGRLLNITEIGPQWVTKLYISLGTTFFMMTTLLSHMRL